MLSEWTRPASFTTQDPSAVPRSIHEHSVRPSPHSASPPRRRSRRSTADVPSYRASTRANDIHGQDVSPPPPLLSERRSPRRNVSPRPRTKTLSARTGMVPDAPIDRVSSTRLLPSRRPAIPHFAKKGASVKKKGRGKKKRRPPPQQQQQQQQQQQPTSTEYGHGHDGHGYGQERGRGRARANTRGGTHAAEVALQRAISAVGPHQVRAAAMEHGGRRSTVMPGVWKTGLRDFGGRGDTSSDAVNGAGGQGGNSAGTRFGATRRAAENTAAKAWRIDGRGRGEQRVALGQPHRRTSPRRRRHDCAHAGHVGRLWKWQRWRPGQWEWQRGW